MSDQNDAPLDFVDFWNDVLAPKFIKYRHVLVDGLSRHSEAAFESLHLAEGQDVVDVGCGFGDTALHIARQVGETGSVLGLDCCQAFLDLARKEAEEAGVANVEFVIGDAQDYVWDRRVDLCFARFGTMFFENPVAGLRNMRAALKPGGRLMMLVWRSIDANPWFKVPKDIVLEFLPPPEDGAKSCGPGPFSMANQEMVTRQLEIAGYTDITFERIDAPVVVGRDAAEAIEFQLALGPAGEVFREAGEEGLAKKQEIEAALMKELSRHQQEEGIVMMSSSWKITAVNPAE
jgi:SAM-dependent methyltransferase